LGGDVYALSWILSVKKEEKYIPNEEIPQKIMRKEGRK
jgi:hypothetical protein